VPAQEPDSFPHAPHDPLVFQQFSQLEKVRPFLQEVLPTRVAQAVRWPALKLMQSRFVDPQLRSHFSDLVYQAAWEREAEPLFFYLLFEHKSFVDVLTPLQILVGMVSLWQEWARDRVADGRRPRLPLVYPLVLYHGEKKWTLSRQFADLVWVPEDLREELKAQIPGLEYALVDLQKMDMEEIRGTAQVRMILGLLKAVSEGREKEWCEKILFPLIPVLKQTEAVGFLKELFTYLARASGRIDTSTFQAMIDRIPDQRLRTDVMTVAEELYDQGWQKGRQEGRYEGQLEGQQKAVLSALETRFGVIPLDIMARIAAMTNDDELSQAMRRAITCASVLEFGGSLP
jgi:predicted transposase YdaD